MYFCRLIWDTISPNVTSAVTHLYYSSFHHTIETYPSRVWGTADTSLVGREFDVYKSLFIVTNVHNSNVDYRVIESDNTQYSNNSIHTFNVEFVCTKINEYLE